MGIGATSCCTGDDNSGERERNLAKMHSAQKSKQEKERERKNAKVVIVGAGPAGIHMCSLLVKAGWDVNNITILEKTDRTAGKSYTVPDSGDGNDIPDEIVHEMGTCYCHPDYHAIFDLFKEYDVENKLKGMPTRGVFGTDLNEDIHNKKEQKAVDFSGWVLAEAERLTVPKELHFLSDAITGGLSFLDTIQRYNAIHRNIFGKQRNNKRHGFLRRPKEEDMKRIDCTFLKFIQDNKLEALIPFFVYSQSVQGYGILDTIPAFYGLFWNTPELMEYAGDVFRTLSEKPNVIVAHKGFEHLWR
eukprot:236406_1